MLYLLPLSHGCQPSEPPCGWERPFFGVAWRLGSSGHHVSLDLLKSSSLLTRIQKPQFNLRGFSQLSSLVLDLRIWWDPWRVSIIGTSLPPTICTIFHCLSLPFTTIFLGDSFNHTLSSSRFVLVAVPREFCLHIWFLSVLSSVCSTFGCSHKLFLRGHRDRSQCQLIFLALWELAFHHCPKFCLTASQSPEYSLNASIFPRLPPTPSLSSSPPFEN